MSTLTTVYATDEDLAVRAPADFSILCPSDQKLAEGTDGAFSPSTPWMLTSGSQDFSTRGILPGQVVQLTQPLARFRPPGEALVIDSVGPFAITLRRKGLASGAGAPPGPAAALIGVGFTIATLGPQIERASYELNRRFGIDDRIAGRRAADLYDPREIGEATVLTVLYRQYLAMSREAGSPGDTFAGKAGLVKSELDDLLARIVVRWGPAGGPDIGEDSTTRFGARLTR